MDIVALEKISVSSDWKLRVTQIRLDKSVMESLIIMLSSSITCKIVCDNKIYKTKSFGCREMEKMLPSS